MSDSIDATTEPSLGPATQNAAPKDVEEESKTQKYEKVKINEGEHGPMMEPDWRTDHPLNLLHAIHEYPLIAASVCEIEFIPYDDDSNALANPPDPKKPKEIDSTWADDFFGTEETKAKLAKLKSHPVDMISFLNISPIEKEEWTSAIDRGSQSATLAVLITQLPNLRVLNLVGFGHFYKPWLDQIWRYLGTATTATILPHLTKIFVSHWDTEGTEDTDVIDEMILIPTLRTLHGHMLGNEDDPGDYKCLMTKAGDTRTSNIEELKFTICGMNHDDITELIKPLANLKKFDFTPYGYEWDSAVYQEGGVEEFREEFEEVAGEMLKERNLSWKANYQSLKIREKKDTSDLEKIDENANSSTRRTHTTEQMPDGTVKHTIGFG